MVGTKIDNKTAKAQKLSERGKLDEGDLVHTSLCDSKFLLQGKIQ